jgi:hypothetical protein
LHKVIGNFGIPRQRPGITAQGRDRRFDILPERGQSAPLMTSRLSGIANH